MQKRSFHSLLFILFSVLVTPLAAQEISNGEDDKNKGEFTMSGSLDSYFHKAFNTIETAPRTSFSNLPGFSLGMINLVGTYKGKKSGFVIDLVYGPRGSDAVFNAPLYKNISGGGSSQIINQMYAYYQVSEKIWNG